MKRTPLNRGSSQLARKPIKRKPGRTRDTLESLQLRRDYAAANPTCEVNKWLVRCGVDYCCDPSVEVHHIIGGAGRFDLVSNLITVSRYAHRWIESNVIAGRLICLIAKSRKTPPEINDAEFCRCSGRASLAGWLTMDDTIAACPTWLEPYRLRLVESLTSE